MRVDVMTVPRALTQMGAVDHLSVFCTEATWHDLADSLIAEYDDVVDRLVFYNPAFDTPDRFERYGSVARTISERTAN